MLRNLSLLLLMTSLSISAEEGIKVIDYKKLDLSESTLHILQQSLISKNKVGLMYNKNGFFVRDKKGMQPIHSTDKIFENADHKDIIKFVLHNKFKLSQYDNGEYQLEAAVGLKGGGAVGATVGANVGLVATNVVGHGILLLVSSFAGPAAPAVYTGLVASYGPMILAASKGVAIGIGIAAGVATGPV